MEKILNLTQHQATEEQVADGVVDLDPALKADVVGMLTFHEIPTAMEMRKRAESIARIAEELGYTYAMIGGAPYFMAPLECALGWRGIIPLYAFSVRESVEEITPDGGVRKVNVFRHKGFVGGIAGNV